MKIPIILDTDPGTDIDDLFALGVALKHPNLNLLGVSTVYGDTQARARLVKKMLRLANASAIPVAAGIGLPLCRLAWDELDYHFTDDLNHVALVTPADPEFEMHFPDAVPFILEKLNISDEPIGLVGIGACTNLGAVLTQATPAQRKKIRFIALMGGDVKALHAEHNIVCDPVAAEVVLNCGQPVFLATFAETKQLFLTLQEAKTVLTSKSNPFLAGLWTCTQMWWKTLKYQKSGPVLYDIIPLIWAATPELIRSRDYQVHVELAGSLTRGCTVARKPAPSGNVVAVSEDLNIPPIKSALLDCLNAFDSLPE
jgi:inosine-uridine nucleoside N-ribohydrolase